MVYIGNLRLQTNRSVHQEDLEILLMGSIFAWQHYFEVFEFCPSAWILKQLTNLTNAMGRGCFRENDKKDRKRWGHCHVTRWWFPSVFFHLERSGKIALVDNKDFSVEKPKKLIFEKAVCKI